ncbi:MAG TPA: hypothetical protein VKA83_04990, partial [Methylomirabilota bacterium]|nr:hypothetical protein [Methylomirabilota bacterium]
MSAAEKPKRISAAEREIMLHEERMAQATKRVSASETVSVKQGGTGTLAGKWYCDGLLIVKEDDEDWSQWLGRLDQLMAQVSGLVAARNLAVFEDQNRALDERR